MGEIMTKVGFRLAERKEPIFQIECGVCDRARVSVYEDEQQELDNAGWVYDEASPTAESFGLGWICTMCQVSR